MKLPKLNAMPVKRRQMLTTSLFIGVLLMIVFFGLYISDPNRKPHPDMRSAAQKSAKDVSENFRTPGKNIDPEEVWRTRNEASLKELQDENKLMKHQLEEMQSSPNQSRGLPSGIPPLPGGNAINRPVEFPQPPGASPPNSSPAFPKNALPALPVASGAAAKPLPPTPTPAPIKEAKISDVSLMPTTEKEKRDDKPHETATIEDSIPAGAFTSAVLLNGLDAPTGGLAKTNPIPMLMRLLNNGTLPNGFQSRVRACFVTGAGYGDLSAERAYVRLEKLSCVMQDGKILDADVDGYIAGEDGKNGMRGTVIGKQGALIARALFAGIASGLGQAIATSYSQVQSSALGTVQTVNPSDVAQVGLVTGVGKGLEKIADFYIARAQELYPVIEVDSNRRGNVIFNKKVSLGPIFAEAWRDDDNSEGSAGLP